MRIVFAALLISIAGAATPAQADPYRWCGVFGGGESNVTNCYFMTIEQCRASMSGNGGFCTPNGFYDGRPVSTPGDVVVRPHRPEHR
jgi:Protein of unknown function (DUF3551)